MNLRALEKVARIGCKYQTLFSLHTLGAPLLGTCTGAAAECIWTKVIHWKILTIYPLPSHKFEQNNVLMFLKHLLSRAEPVWVLCKIMVCLNGVETVNNRCSDLAAVVMFRAGGRPLHSRLCSEDPEVRAVCAAVPPQCVLCSHLCAPSQTRDPIAFVNNWTQTHTSFSYILTQ